MLSTFVRSNRRPISQKQPVPERHDVTKGPLLHAQQWTPALTRLSTLQDEIRQIGGMMVAEVTRIAALERQCTEASTADGAAFIKVVIEAQGEQKRILEMAKALFDEGNVLLKTLVLSADELARQGQDVSAHRRLIATVKSESERVGTALGWTTS